MLTSSPVYQIMQAKSRCTPRELIFDLPAKTLYRETTKIIIDSLLFLFVRTRVQEESTVIIQPEKDRTESVVSNINHVIKLMRADRALEFE